MESIKHKLRSVRGWNADKYQFEITVHSAYNVLPGTPKLKLTWKRGSKACETAAVPVTRGEAV